MKINIGDTVYFKTSVVKRLGLDGDVSAMRGTVVDLKSGGKVAMVDVGNTYYPNPDTGSTIRGIPVANLTKALSNGAIPDWT